MISCFPDMYSGLLVPSDQSAATRFFRVLGDPTRLHILQLLEERELTMSELVATVGQPQPRVSTHLACLRHCGFVRPIGAAKRSSAAWRCAASTERPGGQKSALEPIAERLATCTRIGPAWV